MDNNVSKLHIKCENIDVKTINNKLLVGLHEIDFKEFITWLSRRIEFEQILKYIFKYYHDRLFECCEKEIIELLRNYKSDIGICECLDIVEIKEFIEIKGKII